MPRLAHLVLIVAVVSLFFVAAPVRGQDTRQTITVAGWNVGLDDADINTIAARVAEIQGVDLWGFAEVNRTGAARNLEQAAEQGETGDFAAVTGQSGDPIRLVALYDDTRFDLLDWYEIDAINTTGNARAPLVLHLRDTTNGVEFLFMVNHLYRTRDAERLKQAQMLNDWAEQQALPVIAVGDYNFDWAVKGDSEHDRGYDLMTADGAWKWVRPARLLTTQCSGWPCRYNSVLDFVFAAGPAQKWQAESEIVVVPGDFPDDTAKSDHRPVLARFWPAGTGQAAAPAAAQPARAIANRGANLRGGPGTNFPIVGGATRGQLLAVVGRNAAGDWLRLADESWIAAFLVDSAPSGLAVVDAKKQMEPVGEIQATIVPAAPPVPRPAPTATPMTPTSSATSATAGAVDQQQAGNCDPSYPTLCIPIGVGDLDCRDITARRFPVTGADPHRFDGDGNGIGCERD
jgi:endonuclease/exonuclease/phosphatase family metal-dependent hydrolase